MFSYFIGVKFYKIMRYDCHPKLPRKNKMQNIEHEHHTRFCVSNYNAPLHSESKCNQSFSYQGFGEYDSIITNVIKFLPFFHII